MPKKPRAKRTSVQATSRQLAKVAGHILTESQASFEVTKNPLYAWHALWWCLANGQDLPEWLRHYFVTAAGAMVDLSRDPKLQAERKTQQAVTMLGLRGPGRGNTFERFAEIEANKRAANNLGLWKSFGIITRQKQVVADAVAGGYGSDKTIRNRLTEGRRIKRRAMKLAKSAARK